MNRLDELGYLRDTVEKMLRERGEEILGFRPVEIVAVNPGDTMEDGRTAEAPLLRITMPAVAGGARALVMGFEGLRYDLGSNPEPEQIEAALRVSFRSLLGAAGLSTAGWKEASPHLVLQTEARRPEQLLHRRYGDFYLVPSIDTPDASVYLTSAMAAEYGVTEEQVWSRALRNMRRRARDLRFIRESVPALPAPVWIITAPPDIGAALLTVPEAVACLPVPPENLAAVIPSRTTVMVTEKPATAAGYQRLLQLAIWAAGAHRGRHPLFAFPLVWHHGKPYVVSLEECLGETITAERVSHLWQHPVIRQLLELGMPYKPPQADGTRPEPEMQDVPGQPGE